MSLLTLSVRFARPAGPLRVPEDRSLPEEGMEALATHDLYPWEYILPRGRRRDPH